MQDVDPREYPPKLLNSWFPSNRVPTNWDGKNFELGLSLAGAVSGGAYAAGVMDFLFEALDAWEMAKADGLDVPQHNVTLRIMTGASAGSINGAIAAAVGRRSFPPMRYFEHGTEDQSELDNPFYNTWVKNVGIAGLLSLDDLEDGRDPESLLNSTHLDGIAHQLFSLAGRLPERRRKWLGEHWPLVFTASNLNGVPFDLGFGSQEGRVRYGMRMHADRLQFAVPNQTAVGARDYPPDHDVLPADGPSVEDSEWQRLAQAALASGAFPVALTAREMERQERHYLWRFAAPNDQGRWKQAVPLIAEWPMKMRFVDGGAMNNEPFELALSTLAGRHSVLPTDGTRACKAVVMVAPFNESKLSATIGNGILAHLKPLVFALISQSRFKSDELLSADFGGNYSRYMITPSRKRQPEDADQPLLASGALGAFFGFFSEAYRHHDFFLGRRNAQRFLRDFFVVPDGNPIARHFSPAARKKYRSKNKERTNHIQLIPLVTDKLLKGVGDTALRPTWPKNPALAPDVIRLQRKIDTRLEHILKYGKRRLDAKLDEVGWHGIKRWAIVRGWSLAESPARRWAVSEAGKRIEKATEQLQGKKP